MQAKTEPRFAVRTLSKSGIHYIVFQGTRGIRKRLALQLQQVYEFFNLKRAEIKGFKVFFASEHTEIKLLSEEDVLNYYPSPSRTSSTEIHNESILGCPFVPDDIISYKGKVTRVLVSGCLYELDEGKIVLCVAHQALASTDFPLLLEGHVVLVHHAHIIKSLKPFRLVCCGLSTVEHKKTHVDYVFDNTEQIPAYIQLVCEYGWNFTVLERLVQFVNMLEAHLCPEVVSKIHYERSFLRRNKKKILQELFGCLQENLPSELSLSEVGMCAVKKEKIPLCDFLSHPHVCCTVGPLTGGEPSWDYHVVTIAELHRFLEHENFLDLHTWKYKGISHSSFGKKVVVVGLLSALPDGSPCLIDKTGSIPVVTSRKIPSIALHSSDHNVDLVIPCYGHVVAVSKFTVFLECTKNTNSSHTYATSSEEDIVSLMRIQLNTGNKFLHSSHSTNTKKPYQYFVSALVIPKGISRHFSTTSSALQCSLDSVVISSTVIEVKYETRPDETNSVSEPLNLSKLLSEVNDLPETLQYLEEKKRKIFVFNSSPLVGMSSDVVFGRVYLIRMPISEQLSSEGSSVGSNSLNIPFLSSSRTIFLPPESSFEPFSFSVQDICPKNTHSSFQVLREEKRFSGKLLTEDCVCSLALPMISSVASVLRDYQNEVVNILCEIKEKKIHSTDEDGCWCISLLVSDLQNDKSSNISVYLNSVLPYWTVTRGLLLQRPLLLTCLKRKRSHLGSVYLKSTQDTMVQHLDYKENGSGEHCTPFIQQTLLRTSEFSEMLVTILKITSASLLRSDSTENDLDIKANFLIDDGNGYQALATCSDDTVRDLLGLRDHEEWQLLLFLARNGPSGLHFNQVTRCRTPLDNKEDMGSLLLRRLCLRSQLRRQVLITTRADIAKINDGSIKFRHIYCNQVREIKKMDSCLCLLQQVRL